MSGEGARGVRGILSAGVVLAAVFLLSIWGLRPPVPKPTDAPATEFSAGRARAVLNRLVGDGVPHPVGSPANDAVRSRITAELTQLGYSPETQTGFACDDYGTCATVKNVIARLDGTEPTGGAVLLAAHYDSVPAGPGASDDGAGTAAVLEIARALKALPRPRHSIILLIDDGEEAGLLGARVFVDQHPWAKEVRAAVNLEARGTSGPSLMFETGSANEWIVRTMAQHDAHPATSSIFYTVYKQIPNDTDFSIFKAAGYQGANFAYIRHVAHYHTRLDNFENANPSSLQHHGDNALPMVLALANASLENPPQREAVFFDVFERFTIWWPAAWTLKMTVAAAFLLALEIAWLVWKKRLTGPALLWGLLAWLVTMLVTGASAWLVQWAAGKAGATPVDWIAHPFPLQIAFWSLALAWVSILGLVFARRAASTGLWAGVWIWWALLSVAVAWQTPGLSYFLLIPTCVAALAGLPFAFRPNEAVGDWGLVAAILPLAAAGVVGFGPILLLYDGLGVRILAGIGILVCLVLSPLAPLTADLRSARGGWRLALQAGAIVATILAAFAGIVAPAYSAKSPERVNLEYWLDADSGKAQWVVHPASGHLQEAIRVAINFHRLDKGPHPWTGAPAFLADAQPLDLAAPTFTILESAVDGAKRSYRALLRSERGAPAAALLFPPDAGIDSVRVEGEPVQPQTERMRQYLNGWTYYRFPTMPGKGIEFKFTLPTGKPVEVHVLDQKYGLPMEGTFLLKARPLTATASQDGDVTVVSRRVQLLP
ncbi:MAG: M20/M25/M40 family metallo-hydrolase [Candidatus Acidiferrales bacterium]